MSRPISARVSIAALSANLQQVRLRAPGSRVWAVVKANAYGHGLPAACEGFAEADGLALIEFDHAVRLRGLGWTGPVLMLEGAFDADDVETAAALGLSLAVHDSQQLEWLRRQGGPAIDVWIKVDTGMNRLGFRPEDLPGVHAALAAMPAVSKVSVMTHFADSERPGGADAAIGRFDRVVKGSGLTQSMANSGAVLCVPAAHRDWVRPGIMLYGATPLEDRSAANLGLRAAMSLSSALIAVRDVRPGEGVGYGASFVASEPLRLGIVAGGYADGYPRRAPTGTPIEVAGVRTRTIGRVSMDMIAVDLNSVPHARVGSPVELWGGAVPIDEVAAAAGTIGYELMCSVAPRVPLHIVRD